METGVQAFQELRECLPSFLLDERRHHIAQTVPGVEIVVVLNLHVEIFSEPVGLQSVHQPFP